MVKKMQNKFLTIYNELVRQIQRGEYHAGEILPSEHELKEAYATSRETIRKALNLLVQNGYIHKVRGKGSVVLDHSKFEFPVSGLTSFKELSEQFGGDIVTNVEQLFLSEPEEELQQALGCDRDVRVWNIIRSREINGERIILDKDYVRQDYVKGLTKQIAEESIYEFIEEELGLEISFAKKQIVVEDATAEDERYLDLLEHAQVVVIRSYVYLSDATLFQYTESRHRPDKFQFVDFARRVK
ncbi:GntR family transcriptional regulator, trehalose operon transcriptional repressor [Salimicrobium album]|nr:GntR family transcriptional regulator, trehalose operon transcriptional repressor [Salimicrobium album]SIS80291.1 transcriptional regulator, GntR family [Salimicrobium salexigens]